MSSNNQHATFAVIFYQISVFYTSQKFPVFGNRIVHITRIRIQLLFTGMSQKWKTPRKRKNSAPLATCSNKVSKTSVDRLPLSQPTNRVTAIKKTGSTGKADDPVLDCCDICLKRITTETDNDDDSFVFICTVCKHSSHGKCLDFEESCLDLISAVYKAISWTCKECQELARSAGARGKVTNRVNSSANLTNELNVIRARLAALEKVVFDLTSKASVVPSVVADTRSDHDSTSSRSWSSVAQESSKPATSNNIPIADVIKAVHGDLMNKKHREKNLIITGLSPHPRSETRIYSAICVHLNLGLVRYPIRFSVVDLDHPTRNPAVRWHLSFKREPTSNLFLSHSPTQNMLPRFFHSPLPFANPHPSM